MSMDTTIQRVSKSIQFKEYLLNRDIPSRRMILETCIHFMENVSDSKKAQVLAWLQNLLAISTIMSSEERKNQVRFDACWDELHTEIIRSDMFYHAVVSFIAAPSH
jgi:hypothetical protein